MMVDCLRAHSVQSSCKRVLDLLPYRGCGEWGRNGVKRGLDQELIYLIACRDMCEHLFGVCNIHYKRMDALVDVVWQMIKNAEKQAV